LSLNSKNQPQHDNILIPKTASWYIAIHCGDAVSICRIMKIRCYSMSLFAVLLLCSCQKGEDKSYPPIIILKTGSGYTLNDARVPVGGKLQFGITASAGSAPLTNVRITRIVNGKRIVERDKGIYVDAGGFNYDECFVKSAAEVEVWEFFVMNANRDSVSTNLTVNLGEGSAYGPINHYPSIRIGMQENNQYPNYVDLHNGSLFSDSDVSGHEHEVDLVGFVYLTSGVMSPTLCCPNYSGSSAVTNHYPAIGGWSVRNNTLYDYYTSDNDLLGIDAFAKAQNDSLLVVSFNPGNVSGLCKYCYTGKIIPFKTENGKYGIVHVIHSDQTTDGYMELEIKIQQ